MYKHILYATDFSKASLATEKKVAKMCMAVDAKMSLIHVVEYNSNVWMGAGGYFVLEDLGEESLEDSKKAIRSCEDRIEVNLVNAHSVQGSPKQEIVNYALEIGADLIVLGSHGHRHIADLLGTTATGVLNKANCDVLVIQTNQED